MGKEGAVSSSKERSTKRKWIMPGKDIEKVRMESRITFSHSRGRAKHVRVRARG